MDYVGMLANSKVVLEPYPPFAREGQRSQWDVGPGSLPAAVWDNCRAPGATYIASIMYYLGRRYVGIALVAAALDNEVLPARHVSLLKVPRRPSLQVSASHVWRSLLHSLNRSATTAALASALTRVRQ
eukprot:16252489-Heterocapsa_arctica.AAC.1